MSRRSSFISSTFCQYWDRVRDKLSHKAFSFSASAPRTIYVESATGALGVPFDEWTGLATAMGNTARTWEQKYAPTLRARRTQAAVDTHAGMRSRQIAASTKQKQRETMQRKAERQHRSGQEQRRRGGPHQRHGSGTKRAGREISENRHRRRKA
jgi:hypothetical protein